MSLKRSTASGCEKRTHPGTPQRSQEGHSALSTKRQARQGQVTNMCCENPGCKKARLIQKRGELHLLAFFVMCAFWPAVYMLVCCVYWLVVSMVWVYCCYLTCQRRVSRISLYYGAQTGRFTCKSSPKQVGREGVILAGIVMAPTVDVVLLGPTFFAEDRWTAYVMWGYVYRGRTSGESLSERRLFLYCSCWFLFGLLRGQQPNPSRRVPENVLLSQ